MAASPPTLVLLIEDGGLGIAPVSHDQAQYKIGVCTAGTANTVYNVSNPDLIKATLGAGPLVEAAVTHANKSGGKPQYLIPVNASVDGVSGSITHIGTGPTLAEVGAPYDEYKPVVTITTGGNVGTGAFTISLDDGDSTSSPYAIPSSGVFVVPSTGMTLNFPSGTKSVVAHTGTGAPTPTLSGTALTLDAVSIVISTGGTLGTMAFTWALNGGTASAPVTTSGGSFPFLVPGTGVTITFPAGTYVLADTYSWTITGVPYVLADTYSWSTTAPTYTTGDLGPALSAMVASSFAARGVHIVGRPTNAAGCLAIASLVDSALDSAQASFKFMWGLVESPDEDHATDSQLASAFSAFSSVRVGVAAGTEQLFSDISTGEDFRRSSAWVIAPRAAQIPIAQDVGWVGAPQGAISGINQASVQTPADSFGLWRNETATPGLDAQRFMTLRLFPSYPGIYITKGRMMAPPGSDFSLLQYRQVMDKAAEIAYVKALPFLNSTLPTDPTTGGITAAAAAAIEAQINDGMTDALVTSGYAVATSVQVRTDNNVLSDGIMYVKITVQPFGYASEIDLTLAFTNPALLAA